MKIADKIIDIIQGMEGIGGIPTDKEFLDEFKCRLEDIKPIECISVSFPNYEYEMLIDDAENTPFQTNAWIPIATDIIKDQTKIEEYIAKGMLRKRSKINESKK